MKFFVFLTSMLLSISLQAQNPKGFDRMAKKMTSNEIETISMNELQTFISTKKEIVILDIREENEYTTSHLPEAIWIGYDHLNWSKIDKLNKQSTIIVYCSVGYRSGKIGSELKKKGFEDVKNLYGGIFNWANNKGRLIDQLEKKTTKVHGYNQEWSQWLNSKQCTIVF